MGDWVEELCQIFKQEIHLYNKLLELELEKRNAVNKGNGRSLHDLAKETYNLMVNTSELERVRMKSIEEVYRNHQFPKEEEGITLTDFLNKIDRDSNFKLKTYATELKSTVHKLKDAIVVNEKLIQTRQELLKKTVDEMQKMNMEVTYSPNNSRKSSGNKTKSLVLDASV